MSINVHLSSGHLVDLLDLPPCEIDLWEICRSLSLICRYTGKTPVFYSVAEHTLNLFRYFQWGRSRPLKKKVNGLFMLRCAALMHDFAEAYIGDIIHPIKYWPPIAKSLSTLEQTVFDRIRKSLCDAPAAVFTAPELRKAHASLTRAELGMFCGDGSAVHYADIVTGNNAATIACRLFETCRQLGMREHGK